MADGIKIICTNKYAYHNYAFEEKLEAGVSLVGTEVKALREGTSNIRDSYATFKGNELYLTNAHIGPYSMGNRMNHEPLRSRRLLLHRKQLNKLWGSNQRRGYSLIPLKLYFKKGVVKVEIGLGKSKKAFDKRAVQKKREVEREMDRAMKRARK